jgi:hypothetical protein
MWLLWFQMLLTRSSSTLPQGDPLWHCSAWWWSWKHLRNLDCTAACEPQEQQVVSELKSLNDHVFSQVGLPSACHPPGIQAGNLVNRLIIQAKIRRAQPSAALTAASM